MIDRDKRVRENIGLVHACAKRFNGRGMEYDDIFQAGCEGLIKAADRFDEERGLQFSTYAVPVILGEIKRLFRDGGSVKVGRTLKELSIRAAKETAAFTAKYGKTPTVSELAQRLGVDPEEAAQALGAAMAPLSLTDADEEGGGQIDIPVESPDAKITELLSLRQAIGELAPQDRSLIIFRYFQSRTQVQTAQALGMTQVQVSRREKTILQNMRQKLSG